MKFQIHLAEKEAEDGSDAASNSILENKKDFSLY